MNKKTYLRGWRPAGRGYVEQIKDLILARNKGFNKMVELLHKQLIRKGRIRTRSANFYHPTLKAMVYFIRSYNIKSSAKGPYNYHSHNDLGLNQFFVGQNPYSWYQGDPGDKNGIYHDTSEIVRTQDNATSTKYGYKDLSVIKAWGQGEMVHALHPVFNPFKDREYIYRFPVKAKISCTFEWHTIDNTRATSTGGERDRTILEGERYRTIRVHRNITIDMERWKIKLDGSRQRLADIRDLSLNTNFEFEGKDYIRTNLTHRIYKAVTFHDIDMFENLPPFYRELKVSKIYRYDQIEKLMGQTLEWELVLNGEDDFVDIYLWGKYAGRLVAFGDGDIAGYLDDGRILKQGRRRETKTYSGDEGADHHRTFYYPTLNLIETFDPATHMPTRGAFKFVTEWESHYGLYIKEDKEFWEKALPIVTIVIVIVVTIITVGTMTAQTAAAGSAVTAGTAGATGAGAAATAGATSAGFYSASASALAAIGITSAAGTLALSSIFLSALGYGLSYAGAKYNKEGLIIGGRIASFAGAAMGVASIGASISSALSTATSQAVANQSGCYLTQMAFNGGATSGVGATGLINSGMSITTNLGVTTINSGMGVVSVGTANSSVLFVNGVAMSGSGVIGSMAAQFGVSMTTATELLSLSNIATTTYSIGNNIYNAYNGVSDLISSLRGEPMDPDIPQNRSDEEALAGGNGAIGVSPSVVMRFERDIMPADLGLDQDSLIYVRSLLKGYIHDRGNLANLVDNIVQTRLRKRYAPLIPSNV